MCDKVFNIKIIVFIYLRLFIVFFVDVIELYILGVGYEWLRVDYW